jgi:hypothetical protein
MDSTAVIIRHIGLNISRASCKGGTHSTSLGNDNIVLNVSCIFVRKLLLINVE